MHLTSDNKGRKFAFINFETHEMAVKAMRWVEMDIYMPRVPIAYAV